MSRLAFRLGIILGTFIAFAFTNADASLYASTNGRADSNIRANLAQQRVLLHNMERREAILKSKHDSAAAAREARRISAVKFSIAALQAKSQTLATGVGVHRKTAASSASGTSLNK
ncbi:hypothetical protein [Acidithiobacillus caldus]|uniref:hypothetical protein n=1 Tax=Acidithiobacillus caldus TaxID=33059 RepID=UPI0007D950CD|nr:hypothetical protein [Acidithiobacillus caldus]